MLFFSVWTYNTRRWKAWARRLCVSVRPRVSQEERFIPEVDARDARHARPGSRATPQAQTALVSAPWGACRCHSNVPQASGFTCVARRWTSGSRVGNALCTETLRDGSLMERMRTRPRGSELRCGHGLAALAREAPAAPAARAGSPFPERGAALFPTEREGLRSGAGVTGGWNLCHLSPSRGGSGDFTEFCSLDRDTAPGCSCRGT